MGLNNNFQQEHLDHTKTLLVKAKVGNDSTPFNKTQDSLVSGIAGTENNTNLVQSNGAIKTKYLLLEGQANGDVVREIVFTKEDGTVQAREVIPDTSKNDTLQIEINTSVVHDIN